MAGEGDVHVRDLSGREFEYDGTPGRRHVWYEQGGDKVLARLLPVGDGTGREKTYIGGADLYFDGPTQVYFGTDGTVHVYSGGRHVAVQQKIDTLDAPGHPGSSGDAWHPLQGVPHLNVYLDLADNADRTGESGIEVDGFDHRDDPARYVVEG